MKNFKTTFISTALYLLFIVVCGYGIYSNPNTTKCGKLIDIIQHSNIGKHSTTYENIFVVKYDDGEFDEIRPTLEDYYSNKKGDRVCYEQINNEGWFLLWFIVTLFYFAYMTAIWMFDESY